jgi:hypothetical protein
MAPNEGAGFRKSQCSHFSTLFPAVPLMELLSRAAIIPTFAGACQIRLFEWLSKNFPRDGNDNELRTSRFGIQEDSGHHKEYGFLADKAD